MKILTVSTQRWIVTALLLAIVQSAFAVWQQMSKGRYVYWQDGQSFAFPLGQKPNWYFWATRLADGSQQWWHPEFEDLQTREIRYRVWTNGREIFEKYSTSNYWTQYKTCDAVRYRQWADATYRDMTANTQSDFYLYYLALRNEAQSVSGACDVIAAQTLAR